MSSITRVFEGGKPISAAALERMRMQAGRVGDRPRGLGSAALEVGDISPLVRIPVWVIGRAVVEAAVLSAHAYIVTDGVDEWEIDYLRLIVPVGFELIDGGPGVVPMGFEPAAVAGAGLAMVNPWRAWGYLERGPGPVPDTSDYAVKLYGLVPARGC